MHRKDGRATEPTAFTVFVSKIRGKVGVRLGAKRAYSSVDEVFISPPGLRITRAGDGLLIEGEGVVRTTGESSIAVTS